MKGDYYHQIANPQQYLYSPQIHSQTFQSPNPQNPLKYQIYPSQYTNHTNPMSHHKHILIANKNITQDKKILLNPKTITGQCQTVKDRQKSNSLAIENNNKNKGVYQYMAFKQEHYRLENAGNGDGFEKIAGGLKPERNFQDENKALKDDNRVLKQENAILKEENRGLKEENTGFKEENKFLISKIETLQRQVSQKQNIVLLNERKVYNISARLQFLSNDLNRASELQTQYKNLLTKSSFLQSKIKHLQDSQDYYIQMSISYRQVVQKCSQLQAILQHKDNTIQDTIRGKNQQYNSVVNSKNNQIKQLQNRINILQRENHRIMSEGVYLHSGRDAAADTDKFIKAAGQFQAKIALSLQQNMRLKNIINHLQGKIQQLQTQKTSLQLTLNAFEQRDRSNKSSRLSQQLQIIRQKLQRQQQQHDMQVSKYQLQLLKLQNTIQTKRYETTHSLIDFYDQERLHEGLSNALGQIERLRGRVKGQG